MGGGDCKLIVAMGAAFGFSISVKILFLTSYYPSYTVASKKEKQCHLQYQFVLCASCWAVRNKDGEQQWYKIL